MEQSVTYWLTVEYNATGIAYDALPSNVMKRELDRLNAKWQRSFDRLAGWLSKEVSRRVKTYTDTSMSSALRAQGFKVKFVQTPAMKDAYAAVQAEQVALIKSIPSQCMTQVQGMVQRSVARGRDLNTLTNELQDQFGVTRKRAALIARDQNNKATATMASARQSSLGIEEGIWKHSHAGKTPRPSHVAADGVKFDLKKGLYLEGKWVLPGEDINCRCTWQAVIPGFIN